MPLSRDDVCLGQRPDFGLDADGGQILLDRLGDTRLRIGVGGVEHGLEAIGIAYFGQQRLGFRHVIGIAGEGLVVARHQRRQRLVGRRCATVEDAGDAVLVDRHVQRLANLDGVEGLQLGVQRDVAGVQLFAVDDHLRAVGRILDFEELRLRECHRLSNIDLALLQAQERHQRLLADFDLKAVDIGNALDEIILVALENELLADRPILQDEGAGADRLLAEVA